MLRTATVLIVLSVSTLSAAPVPKTKASDGDAIQGKWKVVEVQHHGAAVPGYETAVATFDKETMTVHGGPTMKSEEVLTSKLDPEMKRIDLTPSNGKTAEGVYALDGDTLLIAVGMGEAGAPGERPKEAKSGPGIAYLKLVRIKEEK